MIFLPNFFVFIRLLNSRVLLIFTKIEKPSGNKTYPHRLFAAGASVNSSKSNTTNALQLLVSPGKLSTKLYLRLGLLQGLPNKASFPRYFCCLTIVTLLITHSKPNLSLTKTKMPNINSSLLALRRKRLGYEQKQIAVLLGHKNTYQISRYETGQRVPGFKEAIKLSVLYDLPVRVLFDRYFRRCGEELENRVEQSGLAAKINLQKPRDVDYCTYLEALNSTPISEHKADNIRRHIKILVEERSKKILGN